MLSDNRRAARAARRTWGVFKVCKNGQLAKTPSVREETHEDALAKAEYMTRINEGSTFVVRSL
jgi:hypothetical protein